ncbi:unnamed protein product [Urochloa humidicola]
MREVMARPPAPDPAHGRGRSSRASLSPGTRGNEDRLGVRRPLGCDSTDPANGSGFSGMGALAVIHSEPGITANAPPSAKLKQSSRFRNNYYENLKMFLQKLLSLDEDLKDSSTTHM